MLQISFIVAFIVIFLNACTWPGMVFSFVGKALENTPDYLKKPLYDCPICMCPWWGCSIVAVGIISKAWIISNFINILFIVAIAAGINTVLGYIIGAGKAVVVALKNDYDCNCSKKTNDHKDPERLKRIYKNIS